MHPGTCTHAHMPCVFLNKNAAEGSTAAKVKFSSCTKSQENTTYAITPGGLVCPGTCGQNKSMPARPEVWCAPVRAANAHGFHEKSTITPEGLVCPGTCGQNKVCPHARRFCVPRCVRPMHMGSMSASAAVDSQPQSQRPPALDPRARYH